MAEANEYNSTDQIAQEIQSIHKLCNLIENYKQSPNSKPNKKTHHKTKSADYDYSTHKPMSPSQEEKCEQIYLRFKKYQINKSEHLYQLKKKIKNEEEEKTKKFGMNKISRELARNDLDFITRMENYKEKAERKRYEEQENLKKKKEEEELKQMEEFHKRNEKKYDKNYLDNKIQSIIQNESKKKTIEKLAQQYTDEIKEVCTFQPNTEKTMDKIKIEYKKPYQKINKDPVNELSECSKISSSKNKEHKEHKEYKLPHSSKIVTHASNKASYDKKSTNKTPDFVNRLYKEDIQKRKQKKEILEDVFAPPFIPIIDKEKTTEDIKNKIEIMPQPETPLVNYTEYLLENESMEDMLRERIKLGRMKNFK
jgi:hypothetical protein